MLGALIIKTKESDIDTVVSIENESGNSQFILGNSKKEHLYMLKDNDFAHLMLYKNEKKIGFVILSGLKNKNKSVEFRRIIIKDKGKGFGRLAIKQIKHYCFELLKCHRLWLDVFETNERARYLYQSEGFVEEGKLRDCVLVDNEYKSLIVMSMLESEYVD